MTSTAIKAGKIKNHIQSCRLCLSDKKPLEDVLKEEDLRQWISDFLSIKVSPEDRLSRVVCSICRIRLVEFNHFRMRCQEVQFALQSMPMNGEDSNDGPSTNKLATAEKRQTGDVKQGNKLPIRCDECHKIFQTKRQLSYHKRAHISKENAKPSKELDTQEQNVELTFEVEMSRDDEPELQTTSIKLEPVDSAYDVRQNQKLDSPSTPLGLDTKTEFNVGELTIVDQMSDDSRSDGKEEISSTLANTIKHINQNGATPTMADTDKPFKCDVCQKGFMRKHIMLGHKKKVHGPRKYVCHICGYSFTGSDSLARHMQLHTRNNDNKEEYRLLKQMQQQQSKANKCRKIETDASASLTKCTVCHKEYQHPRLLLIHFRFAHTTKINCSICNVSFGSSKRLEKHMLAKHKPGEPLKCRECDKAFYSKAAYGKHMLTHLPRNYACTVCPKAYKTSHLLKRHMRSH